MSAKSWIRPAVLAAVLLACGCGGSGSDVAWPGPREHEACRRLAESSLLVEGKYECWFVTTGRAGELRFVCAADVPHGDGELVVEVEHLTVLVATVPLDAVLDLPAMRVRRELRTGEPKGVWFCPMREGSFPIEVRSGATVWQGTWRVVAAGARGR